VITSKPERRSTFGISRQAVEKLVEEFWKLPRRELQKCSPRPANTSISRPQIRLCILLSHVSADMYELLEDCCTHAKVVLEQTFNKKPNTNIDVTNWIHASKYWEKDSRISCWVYTH